MSEAVKEFSGDYFGFDLTYGDRLEAYRIKELPSGDYEIYIQAGSRVTGYSNTWPLKGEDVKGKSYEDIIAQLPMSGILWDLLSKDKELKKFFGFGSDVTKENKIAVVENVEQKQKIARDILTALPEWFGIPESTENYIRKSKDEVMIASFEDGKANGFLCLKETGNATVELSVMGVLKPFHQKGIGKMMFEEAKKFAVSKGYSFMQVKTVQMGKYKEYDGTNRFYLSLGFKEFEVMPELWDESNPCQIYVMSLK